MSQSSELEEGEHPKSEEPSPIITEEDKNNHHHKLYTRGVGALLDGMFQEPEPTKSPEISTSPAKEIPAVPIPETPIMPLPERFRFCSI